MIARRRVEDASSWGTKTIHSSPQCAYDASLWLVMNVASRKSASWSAITSSRTLSLALGVLDEHVRPHLPVEEELSVRLGSCDLVRDLCVARQLATLVCEHEYRDDD